MCVCVVGKREIKTQLSRYAQVPRCITYLHFIALLVKLMRRRVCAVCLHVVSFKKKLTKSL